MPPRRVVITGGGGQLGRALSERLAEAGWDARAPGHREMDITDAAAVRKVLREHRPDWVVNCAAYTAVDAAESDREGAYRVNDVAVGLVAEACAEAGAGLVHISTDYVFDGRKDGEYVESDPTGPINVYGASKLAGEERLAGSRARWAVLRGSWLYSEGEGNFVTRILQRGREAAAAGKALPVVADQVGCPTDVHTLSVQVEEAMRSGLEGLFHAAAHGSASWLELAAEIFRGMGLAVGLEPIRGESLKRPAGRPPRTVLCNRALMASGHDRMIPWKEGLEKVLIRLRETKQGR